MIKRKLLKASPYVFSIVGIIFMIGIMQIPLTTNLMGKIAWTGVSEAAVGSVITAIIGGLDIAAAVSAVGTALIAAAAAGPLVVACELIGRRMLIRWVKRRGLDWVISF